MLWSKSDRIDRSIDHFYFSERWASDWSDFGNDQWTSDLSVFGDQSTSLAVTDTPVQNRELNLHPILCFLRSKSFYNQAILL